MLSTFNDSTEFAPLSKRFYLALVQDLFQPNTPQWHAHFQSTAPLPIGAVSNTFQRTDSANSRPGLLSLKESLQMPQNEHLDASTTQLTHWLMQKLVTLIIFRTSRTIPKNGQRTNKLISFRSSYSRWIVQPIDMALFCSNLCWAFRCCPPNEHNNTLSILSSSAIYNHSMGDVVLHHDISSQCFPVPFFQQDICATSTYLPCWRLYYHDLNHLESAECHNLAGRTACTRQHISLYCMSHNYTASGDHAENDQGTCSWTPPYFFLLIEIQYDLRPSLSSFENFPPVLNHWRDFTE